MARDPAPSSRRPATDMLPTFRSPLARLGLLALLASILGSALAGDAPTGRREYRILHLMSYHSPWRWTDRQFEGFQAELDGVAATYTVFQMDTKRNSSVGHKERKGREARALIERWKPDLVYATDDDAQEYVTRRYVGTHLPVVFSGVNSSPARYGFAGSPNVTGVLEEEHFVQTIALLRRIAPGATRIALIFDDAPMWQPVRQRIREAMKQLPDVRIVADDTVQTFAEYRRRIGEYQASADAIGTIGIFNLKDERGRNQPYQDVQRWTVDNSRLPDFAFWVDRVYHGTLCAVTVSEREQGRAAGRLARAILVDGRAPSALPMKATAKGVPVVSLARARKLGVRLGTDVLLGAEVIQRFEWEQP